MALKDDSEIIVTSWDSEIDLYVGRGDSYMFEIVQNSVYPQFQVKILRKDGSSVTTIDSATFTLVKEKSGAVKVNAQTMVVTGTGPSLKYTFTSAQSAQKGTYKGRITLTHNTAGNPVEPIPELVVVKVRKALA